MSTTAGRVFAGLTRSSLNRGAFIHNSTVRLNSVRSLSLSSQRPAKSDKFKDEQEVNDEPIKFTTSKGKTWKVNESMGSQFKRPWWKVLPVSLIAMSFILWCALRDESKIDSQLNESLYKHLPGLLPDDDDEEEEENQNKPS